MKKAIRYSALAIMLYAVFLFVLVPADRVYAVLKEKAPLPVSLYQVNGSVWNGGATVAMMGTQRLEFLTWELEPLALLLGRLEIALGFSKNDGKMNVTAGRSLLGDYYLRDADASFPAVELESMLSPMKLGLAGNITASLKEMRIAGKQLSAVEGTLIWDKAGLISSADNPVGSFGIDFATTEEGIRGVLKDSGGPLQADGILVLKPDGSYQLTASFTPRDAGRDDIKQALRFLGTPDPAGKVSVSKTGNLQLEKYLPFISSSG